jgi:hypothetical protein
MMNRDLMQRQMFRNGGGVVPMEDGGEPTFKEKILAVGRGVVPMAGGGAASMPTLSREDLQLFLQNYPDYLENNSLYDEKGVVNPEVMQAIQMLKEGNVTYYDPLRPAPSFVPTPSRQLQVSPAQIQDFLRNNPGYLEEKGSVYGDDGNVKPEVDRQLQLLRRQELLQSQPGRMLEQEVDRQLQLLRRQELLQSQPGRMSEQEVEFLRQPPVYGMQEGGMAPMGMPPGMPPQGMMPAAPPAAMPEMAQAQQAGMDPAILEQMLAQASQGIGSLDEAEDYEQVMNMMTGTSATIAERRMELADLVGDEDAQQTPDSVLTLVQPVIMMAKTEEGIGGLAQDQMTEAVTGDMAGGIMSTIDMGAQEGPAPVNFRYGGAVQYMEPGGVAGNPLQQDPNSLENIYKARKDIRTNIFGDPSAGLEKQKDLTQAQMLFDLSNVGLAIATPGPQTMSPAEKLAYGLQSTDFFNKVGSRAQTQLDREQAAKTQKQQLDLSALQSAEEEFGREAQRQFQGREKVLDRALELTKQSNQLNFSSEERKDAQGFQRSLENERNELQRTLQAIRGDQSKESIRLQGDMNQRLAELNNEFSINENQLKFENRLEEIGVLNLNDLSKMDKGQEFNKELSRYQNELSDASREKERYFTASQNALTRLENYKEREFRREMQEELQKFNMEQSDIDRAIDKAQRAIENGFKEKGLTLDSERLDLETVRTIIDEEYKSETLQLEREAREASKLDKTSGVIKYITDAERLERYASGEITLDERNLLEQQILDYARKPEYQWNGSEYAPTVPQLAPAILNAMSERKEKGLDIPNIAFADTAIDRKLEPGKPTVFDSLAFNQSLFDPEIGVNFESPEWDRIPTYLSDTSNLNFTDATGLRSIGSRISGWIKERVREPLSLGPLNNEQRNNLMVDKVFQNLRIKVEQATLTGFDDRVLKSQVERIDKSLAGLAGGAFTTDEEALRTLNAVRASLSGLFENAARVDPRYNPAASRLYDAATIQKYRKQADDIRGPLADVIKLERAYRSYVESLSLSDEPGSFDVEAGRRSLNSLRIGAD